MISDIHSNLVAFETILEHIENNEVDKIFCCGDLVGYGAKPNEVVKLAKENKIIDNTVLGNHDEVSITGITYGFTPYAATAVEWTHRVLEKESIRILSSFPEVKNIQVDDTTISLVHGSLRDPVYEYVPPSTPRPVLQDFLKMSGSAILIMGHTHLPMEFKFKEGFVLNPGSVGQPRDRDPRASYMILQLEGDQIIVENLRVEYDISKTASEIKDARLPPFLAERLFQGR